MFRIILCVVCLFVFTSFVLSQEDIDSTNTVFKPNTDLNITISKFNNSDIKIDGVLDELVWQDATRVGNFSETHPGDMVEPEVQTEALMFYDDNNIYFAFICYDNDMSKLRSTFADRDKTTYQFSKNLFARLILEYNSFTNQFNIDPLISYKLNPFSIFYIGSAHQVSELEDGPGHNKLVETERQIFLKFQYLWRL